MVLGGEEICPVSYLNRGLLIEAMDPSVDDLELLESYTRSHCEQSFRKLVERHLRLVLGCAFRVTGDRQLAEEVAQKVFVVLANKAARFRPDVTVGAWLHRATVFEATRARRGEIRRKRKLEAYSRHMSTRAPKDAFENKQWNDALSVLDEAIDRLPRSSRMVIVLRFFEGRNYRDIGARVGKSEEATRKQITRALQRLSAAIRREGPIVPVALLCVGLADATKYTARANFVSSVSSVALSETASGTLAWLTMNKITLTIIFLAAIPLALQGLKHRSLAREVRIEREALARTRESISSNFSVLAPRRGMNRSPRSEASVLLELATQIQARRRNPDEARSLFAAVSLIRLLEVSTLPRALELIRRSSDGDTQLHLYEALFDHWASLDAIEAMRHAEQIRWISGRIVGLEGVFRAWVKNDPEAALAAVSNANVGYRSRWRIRESATQVFVVSNPRAAAQYLTTMEQGPARETFLTTLASGWSRTDVDAVIQWAEGLEDQRDRESAISSFVRETMDDNPENAIRWAATLSPEKRDDALKNAFRQWRWMDRAAAEEWIATYPELTPEVREKWLSH